MERTNRSSSPIRAAVLVLAVSLLALAPPASAQIPTAERDALIALYNSTNGPGWSNNTNWLGAVGTECTWFGVTCQGGVVTELSFFSNQLSGSIPPELGNLSNLQFLSLTVNQLTGSIPPALGNLSNLQRLHLFANQLSGSIPPELGSLSNIQSLLLSRNQLSGSIPPALGSLSNLWNLWLDSNQLSGSIPSELGQLSSLRTLYLNSNQLSGSIPPELGQLSSLFNLRLDSNQLSGSIPPELGNLSNLRELSLHSNQMSGSIPPQLGNLSNLQRLVLNSNQLSGSIPPELAGLTGVTILDLSWNALYATDPAVDAWATSRQGDWKSTQTVTPTGISVDTTSPTTASLSWTPIPFASRPGRYEIQGDSGTGATLVGSTADKTVGQITLFGLAPQTTYTFTVRTVTDPHSDNTNTVVSEYSNGVVATTTVPTPEVGVVRAPDVMGVVSDGVSVDSTTLTIANLGGAPTTVTLMPSGTFFTLSAMTVNLAPATTASVTVSSLPVTTAGDYRGSIALSGAGVPAGLSVAVTLLAAQAPATGEPRVEVESTRVDVSAPEGTNPTGSVTFRNIGTATATGVLGSDQPWIVPQSSLLSIEPGQSATFTFTIDRALRPDADALAGSQQGTLSFIYLAGSSGTAGKSPFAGAPTLAAPVRISDTVKPKDKGACPGVCVNGIPVLEPDEVGLVVPGIGHITGSVGLFISDVTIANRGGTAIDDVGLYFAGKGVEQPVGAGRSVSLADVAATAFDTTGQIGALHLRSRNALALAMNANVFVKSNPAGTFGTAIPVFRTDRGAASGEVVTITGLRKTPTSHTNVYLQEVRGADATARVEFLDAGGTVLDVLDRGVPAFGTTILGQALVPEGSVTARVTSTGAGAVVAFATPVDRASNDTWVVADWNQVYGFAGTEGQFVAVAGSAPGRNETYFQTDLAIHASAAGTARLRYYQQAPAVAVFEKEVPLAAGETREYDDVLASLFGTPVPSLGAVEVIPEGGLELRTTSRTYTTVKDSPATFGTGVPTLPESAALQLGRAVVFGGLEDSTAETTTAGTPATFRTNIGLVEITGAPVRVRVSVLLFDGKTLAAGGTTASKEYDLGARQWHQLNAIAGEILGRDVRESEYGELRNIQVRVEVVGGEGAVLAYATQTDNGTGDTVLRFE